MEYHKALQNLRAYFQPSCSEYDDVYIVVKAISDLERENNSLSSMLGAQRTAVSILEQANANLLEMNERQADLITELRERVKGTQAANTELLLERDRLERQLAEAQETLKASVPWEDFAPDCRHVLTYPSELGKRYCLENYKKICSFKSCPLKEPT